MRFLLGFLFIWCCISCKKYNKLQNDANEESYIRGRLFLFDTMTQNSLDVPLKHKKINILYYSETGADTTNYIFSTTSDENGYFTFKNLTKGANYRVFYEEKIDSERSIIYSAVRAPVAPPFDTLILRALPNISKESGIHFTILDINGAPVAGANVCIFQNSAFFKEGSCDSATFGLTTDRYGHCFKFNIPKGKYYITAYKNGLNDSSYTAKQEPYIEADTVLLSTLTLIKKMPTGFKIKVVDEDNNPLPKVSVCFFTSSILYNSGNGNCSASNFTETSNDSGFVQRMNVIPATYYAIAGIAVDTFDLTGKGAFEVLKGDIKTGTIILLKKAKPAVTGFKYTVVDEENNPVPGVRVCFFTSKVLADNTDDNCSGSNFTDTSDSNGIVEVNNILPATYYAVAGITVNDIEYSGTQTIKVEKDDIAKGTIQIIKK